MPLEKKDFREFVMFSSITAIFLYYNFRFVLKSIKTILLQLCLHIIQIFTSVFVLLVYVYLCSFAHINFIYFSMGEELFIIIFKHFIYQIVFYIKSSGHQFVQSLDFFCSYTNILPCFVYYTSMGIIVCLGQNAPEHYAIIKCLQYSLFTVMRKLLCTVYKFNDCKKKLAGITSSIVFSPPSPCVHVL